MGKGLPLKSALEFVAQPTDSWGRNRLVVVKAVLFANDADES